MSALVKLAEDPETAMTMGGRVKVEEDWQKTTGKAIMKKAAKTKFQIPHIKKKLLNTGTKELIERTRNKVWACGLSFGDDNVSNVSSHFVSFASQNSSPVKLARLMGLVDLKMLSTLQPSNVRCALMFVS